MKKMHLIKEYICGEKGMPACVVDMEDMVLRTSKVCNLIKEGADVLVETNNSVYCTALYYEFGWFAKLLKPVSVMDLSGEICYHAMRLTPPPSHWGFQECSKCGCTNTSISDTEECEVMSIAKTFCDTFPTHYHLRQFCRAHGKYGRFDNSNADFIFEYKEEKIRYIFEVFLLKQDSCHMKVHCCRKN